MATEQRDYLLSERVITNLFAASAILMVLVLFALALIATARPQGRLANVNTSQHEAVRERALDNLTGYRQYQDGTITIDINRAMDLTVDRGLP